MLRHKFIPDFLWSPAPFLTPPARFENKKIEVFMLDTRARVRDWVGLQGISIGVKSALWAKK